MQLLAFKQSNQDTTCITSIDDTVEFVYGHTEAFMEIICGIIALIRGFKYKAVLRDGKKISYSGKNYLLPG